jgi:hypothetical protein
MTRRIINELNIPDQIFWRTTMWPHPRFDLDQIYGCRFITYELVRFYFYPINGVWE